jgi:hypothetical protein
MSEPRLDWNTAKVHRAKLSVGLGGDLPPGWGDTFQTTVRLLDRGEWEKVKIKKRGVRVGGVIPGSEDKLRHFLESIVQQANADHRQAHESRDSDDSPVDEADVGTRAREDDSDAQMTERFRGFGDSPPETP